MRKPMGLLVTIAVLGLSTASARAGEVIWGGEVFGAFNGYSMSDINRQIASANADLAAAGLPAGLDEIKHGFSGGLGLRIWATPNVMLNATFEPLFAESKDDFSADFVGGGGFNHIEGSSKLNVDGNSFQFGGSYFLPSQGKGRIGFGGSIDYNRLSGEVSQSFVVTGATDTSGAFRGDLEGSGVGFHFHALGEWTVSPGFALTAALGYRIAKIDDTKLDGVSSNPKIETDYSGVLARVGLAFYLPGRQ